MTEIRIVAQFAKFIEAKPDEAVVNVAKRSFRLRLERVQTLLPLAALQWDKDIEYVHALRVSSRRAQAALAMYREFVPQWRAAWMEEQLKHIRGASNNARDDDVFVHRLEQETQHAAAMRLAKRVRGHRCESQALIVDVYDRLKKNNRFERRIVKLIKRTRLRGKKIKSKDPSFSEWANMKFERVLDVFFSAAKCDYADVKALHNMRIQGKKVRYAMELLSGAFPAKFRTDAYSGLEKLQDKLGKINDHVAAEGRIQFWIGEAVSAKKPEIKFLKESLKVEERLLLQSLDDFCLWWNRKREAKLFTDLKQLLGTPND